MGLKLDMNKAYDRIEWDFVEAVMLKLGFNRLWVRLIMGCITSVRFTVLLNGQAGVPFKPTRGIRQGDPISPYIFILVCDVLSSMLNKAVDRGIMVNFEKSSIFFSPNTPQQLREKVGQILHVCITDNPGKYLGLPTMWGRSKREALNFVKEKMLSKSWRLITEPNSFWALIMKSRYFPSSNFLQANKGARASWAWASILAGRDVIERGSHWQILNGTRVRLWRDKWLPVSPDGLLHPIAAAPVNANELVSEIIDPNSMKWDLSTLNGRISDQDARRIKALPIGGSSDSDRLVWPYNKAGCYSCTQLPCGLTKYYYL
ncbi:unnamed protein product [Prunus brigantina]